uniref:Uncharacterized protein ycf35 n=1 Tax=Leiomenia cribrosa TaxID=217483 RepID=A0A4D6WXU7_9FLOR|nr:hypothetical protein [Leiomenia cribrosa]
MSHLTQIKTKITNKEILGKTLNDLGFTYQYIDQKNLNMIVKDQSMNEFEFNWNNNKYSLIADTDIWQNNIKIENLINKITQQYSYNCILETSVKEGFNNVSKDFLQDGSIKIVIQRWCT